MPTLKDTAICLRRWDFSETSQTVSLFAREHGVIRGLAKGAKRAKGSFSGGFDVLARGNMVAIVKAGRDLATLTEWQLEETYRVLRQRLDANRAGLYMADLVQHMLTVHDPHPRLFDSFAQALRDLSSGTSSEAVLLRFQWVLLEEAGYRPSLDANGERARSKDESRARGESAAAGRDATLRFDAAAGGIVTEGSGSGWPVRRATVELLRRVAAGEAPAPSDDDDSLRRANRLLAAWAREVIGEEPPALAWAFPELHLRGPPLR